MFATARIGFCILKQAGGGRNIAIICYIYKMLQWLYLFPFTDAAEHWRTRGFGSAWMHFL
jgi:hypothetical protein